MLYFVWHTLKNYFNMNCRSFNCWRIDQLAFLYSHWTAAIFSFGTQRSCTAVDHDAQTSKEVALSVGCSWTNLSAKKCHAAAESGFHIINLNSFLLALSTLKVSRALLLRGCSCFGIEPEFCFVFGSRFGYLLVFY